MSLSAAFQLLFTYLLTSCVGDKRLWSAQTEDWASECRCRSTRRSSVATSNWNWWGEAAMVGAGQATRRQNQSKLLAVFCRHEMCRRGRRQCARKRGMYTD